MASTAPAAPRRWPIMDFVPLMRTSLPGIAARIARYSARSPACTCQLSIHSQGLLVVREEHLFRGFLMHHLIISFLACHVHCCTYVITGMSASISVHRVQANAQSTGRFSWAFCSRIHLKAVLHYEAPYALKNMWKQLALLLPAFGFEKHTCVDVACALT